jgi:hypothetical protein
VPFKGEQFGDLGPHLLQPAVQDLTHMAAGRPDLAVDGEDLPYLLQGQIGGLPAADEPQPVCCLQPYTRCPVGVRSGGGSRPASS